MNQWTEKKVAFLGDSITDKNSFPETKKYWNFLEEYLGLQPFVYGISGQRWEHIIPQAQVLQKEHGDDVDAIFIFAGTNDWGQNISPGEWWTVREEKVNYHGDMIPRNRRTLSEDMSTTRGCINAALRYMKENFPLAQVILLTPIHRGKAAFSMGPVPDESCANAVGFFLSDYADAVREAGRIWSVPVIDLFEKCGMYPVNDAHTRYYQNPDTDRCHPSEAGQERMAKTILYQMLALPSTFR